MSSLKKNFSYSIIYQVLIMILPLITMPYISRVMGASGIGTYSYTHSIAYYFSIFAMLGLNNYGNRSIAQVRDDKKLLSKTFCSIYAMQLGTATIVLIVYYVYVFKCSQYLLIAALQGVWVAAALLNVNWFFFGNEEFRVTVTRSIIIKLMTVALILSFVKTKSDLVKYVLIMVASNFLSQMVLWPVLLRRIKFIKPSLKEITRHMQQNLVLFIPVIAVSIYRTMDRIMLGLMSNMSEVGFYENSGKIISIPMSVITALGIVMLPRMSNLFAAGLADEMSDLIEKSMLFTMVAGSAFMFGIAGIAPVLAPVFFGQEFIICGNLISSLAFSIIFITWANVIRTQFLIPTGKDKIYIVTVCLGAIVNFIINYLTIPLLRAQGAVLGTIVAEITVCLGQTFMVRKEIDIKLYLKNGMPFLGIGLIMFGIVRYIGEKGGTTIYTLMMQITIGAGVFVFLTLIYVVTTKNESISRCFNSLIKRK